ncbi:tRNA (adenosine(37)-N6)-dimethylallyltransferase MiaA [Pedobacter frigoris]|uniref:tRNA dimethylallyltransferase n=1 Tax=Pedobacter frigoris TaxID=2571272 RepID=A0A4V5NZP5_9SPHI|nr:tRNA (adenosine(37)-N6)-dimethylallyltransferase MiaA [Pedobacter frigoris]TKC09352.1 tRNA (adenosine(37)-N6)-dimethylallyltransferase MiaA [Pedobacter frigoris]
MLENPLLVILGPTASGKTNLAVRLAVALHAEIISADSRQVFRGMDIGTGKDLGAYEFNGRVVPYHLIDIKEAGEKYNVNEFKEDFYRVFGDLTNRDILPILCGGTGMYIHSVLQNQPFTAVPVDEELRNALGVLTKEELRLRLRQYPLASVSHADLSSHKRMIRAIEIAEYLLCHELVAEERPVINPFVVGLTSDVALRREKVIRRLEARFDEGLIPEVKMLLDCGVSKEMLEFYGLEYKFISAYLFGEMSISELKERLSIAICQFAKRQMTFFRKMEKDGVEINWYDASQDADDLTAVITDSFNRHMRGVD